MRKWVLLIAAIAVEVAATLSLRASQDQSAWLLVVAVGYVGSFILLTMVLRIGMPVGVAYGIWGPAARRRRRCWPPRSTEIRSPGLSCLASG